MFFNWSRFTARLGLLALLLNQATVFYAIAENKVSVAHGITYKELHDVLSKDLDVKRSASQEKVSQYVERISYQDKSKLAFDLLSKSGKYTSSFSNEKSAQGLRNLHHDIELFKVVFPRINRASTIFGEALLAKMLATPFTEIEILQKRQDLIELLANDQALFDELKSLVERVKDVESAMLSYWQEESAIAKDYLKSFYFNTIFTQNFNKSESALEASARWDTACTIWPLVSELVTGTLPVYWVMKYQDQSTSVLDAFIQNASNIYNPMASAATLKKLHDGGYDAQIKAKLPDENMARHVRRFFELYHANNVATWVLNVFYKIQGIKAVKESMRMKNDFLYRMQARLGGFATLIDVMTQINEIVDYEPAFEHGLVTAANLKTLQAPSKVSKEFSALIKVLKTETFKGDPSFFSYIGRVLFAHRYMKKYKNNFAGMLETLGEVDACLSIAHLIKEYKNERVHYSFVKYRNADKPYFKLTNFWNPMVNHATVVPNSIELGAADSMRSMILTGSNTAGKSTLLKGMLINVLLAQTLCIAPADDIVLTPFVYLGSSLNIVDNTQGGQSLYQAELDRASLLIKSAEFFRGIGHCFLVIDELFRGTGPDKAEEQTANCARVLLSKENTSFVLATHYKKYVTALETESFGACKNFKIEAYEGPDGKIIRPFLIEPGISSSNITNALLDGAMGNEGFADKSK